MTGGYRRVLLKLSGEALGSKDEIFDFERITDVARMIAKLWHTGAQVALVIGGGNIWRGRRGPAQSMNRVTADHMGMLGTVINALAMQDALERVDPDISARVMTAVDMRACAEPYCWRQAIRHLERGRIVIFGYGTGDPLHSTDTAAAQRAVEIEADAMLFAKNVDGVYDKNPSEHADARLIPEMTYDEALRLQTSGVDAAALIISRENGLGAIRVFTLLDPQNIMRAAGGEPIGTTIHP